MKIYLAGGIGKLDWRHRIVHGLRDVNLPSLGEVPILRNSIHFYGEHDYVGPFFVSCDHGGYHGPTKHGSLPIAYSDQSGRCFQDGPECCPLDNGWKELLNKEMETDKDWGNGDIESNWAAVQIVYNRAIMGISQADYFFAWIDRDDVWGTIFELGVARGLAIQTGLPYIGIFVSHNETVLPGSPFSDACWFPLLDAICALDPVEAFEGDFAKYVPYEKLLLSPKWQKRRLAILNDRKWKCEQCKSANETLHVHHKKYGRTMLPWEARNDDLEVLCASCHQQNHRIQKNL